MDTSENLINILAALNIVDAVILIALSTPLILRRVSMNHLYGARFSQSFKSQKNWYDINAASGKLLLGWSMPILGVGIYGLFASDISEGAYTSLTIAVTLISVATACILSYVAAVRIDKRNRVV